MIPLPPPHHFTRRQATPLLSELSDSSDAVVATFTLRPRRDLYADIDTSLGKYRLSGRLGRRVQDRAGDRIVFTLASPLAFTTFDRKIMSADGKIFRFQYSGTRRDGMTMQMLDDRKELVMSARWLVSYDNRVKGFPLGEAIVYSTPEPEGDTPLLVGLAFQMFQRHVLRHDDRPWYLRGG